jgi:hypothetical protein
VILNRRGFLGGLISALAAPAIVRAGSIMPVKAWPVDLPREPLPGFGFESFTPPEGTTYQWATRAVMGDETLGNLPLRLAAGWRLVPAERWASKFAIDGAFIEHGGLVLLERDAEVEASKNLVLTRSWFRQAEDNGFQVSVTKRPAHGKPIRVMNADGDFVDAPQHQQDRWRKVTAEDIERWSGEG